MISPVSGLFQARPAARLFRGWWLFAGALACLPIASIWRLTGDTDATVTTLALFAGAAWQIGLLSGLAPQRPSRPTRIAAWVVLTFTFWQLGWVGTNDFWFFRLALMLVAAAWLLLAWGWAGWIWGWRVLAAFVVWGYFCDSPWQWTRDGYQWGDRIGPWLAQVTARLAGSLLAICGLPVSAAGNAVSWGGYSVSVGVPCTALPLVKLLLLLLLLVTLLLRLDWLRAAWLALVALIASFVISLARVMLLAEVVREPSRFHYWHDADAGGGGWFTAAGMLALAFFTARQLFRQAAITDANSKAVDVPAPPPFGWILGLGAAAWAAGVISTPIHSSNFAAPVPSPAYRLVGDETTIADQAPTERLAPNEPAWIRRLTYRAANGPGELQMIIAAIPQTLTGDPGDQPALTRLFAGAGPAWAATIVSREPPIHNPADWKVHLERERGRRGRWLAWITHRRAWREKQSYWLGAGISGSALSSDNPPPKLFADWVAILTQSR